MRTIFSTLFLGLSLMAAEAGATTERGTMGEVINLVQKVGAYLDANGKEKTIAEINDPKGQFREHGLFVTIHDMNGKLLAHGADAKLVGTDLLDWKDADGKALFRERLEFLKTREKGVQDYRVANPRSKSKQPDRKSSYYEKRRNGVVISADVFQ